MTTVKSNSGSQGQSEKATSVSETTKLNILHNQLGMSRVSACWVPRSLSSSQRKVRIDCNNEFLRLCGSNSVDFCRIKYKRDCKNLMDIHLQTDWEMH